jgi:hypothetical protein
MKRCLSLLQLDLLVALLENGAGRPGGRSLAGALELEDRRLPVRALLYRWVDGGAPSSAVLNLGRGRYFQASRIDERSQSRALVHGRRTKREAAMSLIAMPELLVRRRRALAVIALTLLLPGVSACARGIATAPAPAPSVATPSPDPDGPAPELMPSALPIGARIRYHVHDDWLGLRTGKVGRATADTVWLANGRALPVSNLRRLELSLGGASVERRMAWGAGIGASVGVLTGVLIPAPDTTGPANPPPRAAIAYIFATSAAVVGTIVGALLPGERWERVPLPSIER